MSRKRKEHTSAENGEHDILGRLVVRFQVELLATRLPDIERIMLLSGSRTKREAFEHCLTIGLVMMNQACEGDTIGWQNREGGFTAMVYQAFENAKAYGKETKNGAESQEILRQSPLKKGSV
jgi:hypothetical protein